MKIETRSKKICKKLKTLYPDVKTGLRHKTPFQLLISTILSAQCTDRQVNSVTGALFEKYPTPKEISGATLSSIEKLVHSTGFYRNKAKHIKNCSKTLMEKYQGEVPKSLDALVTLPGVGRKTANVVLGSAFGIPGVVVDTHVSRISQRLGLTRNKTPQKIEFDLMEIIPEKEWNDFGLRLIYFGREYCKAQKPLCPECPITDLCPHPEKSVSAAVKHK